MLESGNTLGQMWLREIGVLECFIRPGTKGSSTVAAHKMCSAPAQLSRRPHPPGTGAAGEGGRKEGNTAALILCRGRL